MCPVSQTSPSTAGRPVALHEAMLAHSPTDVESMRAEIAARKPAVDEFGPAYAQIAAKNRQHAANFAVAFTRSIQTTEQLGRMFGMIAVAPATDRKEIVVAHRDADDGVTVAHAIGAQPIALARPLMQDFLVEGGTVHEKAAGNLAEWLEMAGGQLIKTGIVPPAPTVLHDSFLGDLWNDTGGKVIQAAKTVVDAVGNAVGDFVKGISHAIAAVAGWAANQVKNFVHALLTAGKAIGDLIGGAVAAGEAVLTKIVQGILAVGRAVRDVLQAVASFTLDAVVSTLKALKALGTSLAGVVGWLVGKTFDVVKKFVEAMIRVGEQIGEVLAESVRLGAALLGDTLKAMLELGQAAGTILIAAVTHPANIGTAVMAALHTLGHSLASLLDDVRQRGAQYLRSVATAAARIATDAADLATYAARAAVDTAREVVAA
jgi:hypothetical protein